ILLPRRREGTQAGYHPPPESGHHPAGPPQPAPERLVVGHPVEERDVREVRRQVGVVLQAPHERLEVAHPGRVSNRFRGSHGGDPTGAPLRVQRGAGGSTRTAALAKSVPRAAPAITSDAWWIWTWTRLVATTA